MRQAVTKPLFFFYLVALSLAPACSGDGEGGHDVNKGGVMHRAGLEDPLRYCTECHGADLRGGSGPDCLSCHASPASHTTIRDGVAHNSGTASTCSACHGPDNAGGIGPACSTCH